MKYRFLVFCMSVFVACAPHNEEHHHHDHDGHDHHNHNHAEEHHDHEHEGVEEDDEEHGEHSGANVVEFHDETAALIDFRLDTCKAGVMQQTIKTVAQIQPALQDEHVIVAKACGIITLSQNAIVGNKVAAGQVIATTLSSQIEGSLRSQQQQAQAELERAEAELRRKEKLAEEHIVSQSELTEAQADYRKAKAAVDDLNNVSSNGQSVIKASETEYIRHLYVQNGQMVNPGDAIASVSHNMNLFLRAEIQPRYYKQLQQIDCANINVNGEWHDICDFQGRFISFSRSTSVDSPLLPVIFEISGNADLVDGTFVEMYIKTKTRQQTLSVPRTALIEEMGDYYVFVKVADERYEKREVQIGQTDGQLTEIKSGLKDGEIVVGRGAVVVKLAMTSGALDAHSGHVH